MSHSKRILVAPLNWGLGHASRCVPIINQLIELNCEVIIAADGGALNFLEMEFPNLKSIRLPDINLRYSKFLPIGLHLLFKIPSFFSSIKKENKKIKEIIEQFKIDAIISDNRYGIYSKSIKSVLITHQINIQIPFFKRIINSTIENLISKFNHCWIPDYEGDINLSGELSHSKTNLKNITYIGPQSRFQEMDSQARPTRRLAVVLSGPEPSRSKFEKRILNQLKSFKEEILIIRGKINEGKKEVRVNNYITMIGYLTAKEMQEEILNSEVVLCRSGYSSVMDLFKLKKNAILVPTPGQAEQEYLSRYLMKKSIFYCVDESKLNIREDLKKALEIKNDMKMVEPDNLDQILKDWLKEV